MAVNVLSESECEASVDGEEPSYRPGFLPDDPVGASFAFVYVVYVIVCQVVMECGHDLEIEAPYAEVYVHTGICREGE